MADPVTLCLTGDVMTGRGVDQILSAPGDPQLWEGSVNDARTYVRLAEDVNGPIPHPVAQSWPWGEASEAMAAADLRLLNVETSVTTSDQAMPGKGVHYRMNPANVETLQVVAPDACVLANNHVLDFGVAGLRETLDVLAGEGLATVGAGREENEAWKPLELMAGDSRVLVWSVGAPSSGVPASWAAGPDQPGVAFLPQISEQSGAELGARVARAKRPGDLAVVSVHWGSNWGYRIEREQTEFAHQLVQAGVDVVHGHSSHHPRPVEVYKDRLILYGCGDLINDYEGISGHGGLRPELRPVYLATLDGAGRLQDLTIRLFKARQMRLVRASDRDARWLARTMNRSSRRFGSRFRPGTDGTVLLQRTSPPVPAVAEPT